MQSLLDKRYANILNWTGSNKDWTTVDEFRPSLDLYNSSIANNEDYAGEGLLSPNALSGGNAGQLGVISKQIKDRRQSQAAGDAYNSVMGAVKDAETGGQWSAGMDQSRNMNNAGMQNDRYTAWLQRPKKPSFWENLLMGGLSASSGLITKI